MSPSDVVLAVLGVVLGLLAGLTLSDDLATGAVLVAGCLLLLVATTRPIALGLLAALGTFGAFRVGAGGLLPIGEGVSYSDAILVLAAPIALTSIAATPQLRRLRGPLIGLAVYLACLLPTVVTDESTRGWFEWGHRLFLVGGAVVVGAWLTREGKQRLALRLLLAAGCLLAAAAILDSARRGFSPAYPYGLHKNFVGAQLSMILIVAVAARKALGLRLLVLVPAALLVAGGLLASQSRGGMLAAATGLVVVLIVAPHAGAGRARAVLPLVIAIGLAGFVLVSVRADLDQNAADLNNNSIGVRRQVEARTIEIWKTSPVTGVGLKYFNSGEWGPLAQAPNIVVDNELAESGVLGLAGFVVLQGAVVGAVLRRRRDDRLVVVGGACVVALLVHGMVDIYWIAGSATLPFLLLGLGLATRPPDEFEDDEPALASAPLHPELVAPQSTGRHRG